MTRSAVQSESWRCAGCGRVARTGESSAEIEERESQRQHAIGLLDVVLGDRAERETDRQILTAMEERMGQMIQTRGCSKCGGTMYRTVDTDENGNPTSVTQFICTSCGHME